MPIEIETPEGIAEFPDDTSQETITAALRRRFPPKADLTKYAEPPGEIGGTINEFRRGLLSGQQQLIAAEMADVPKELSVGKMRKAFMRGMTDPRYQDALTTAGNDPVKIARVEKTFGPTAQEDVLETDRKARLQFLAEDVSKLEKEAQAIPSSKAMKEWGEADNANWWKVLAKNPVEIAAGIVAQSLPAMAPSLAANMVAPGGRAVRAIAAGAGSYNMEAANAFLDSARQAGYDFTDPDKVQEFFLNPEAQVKARQFAATRGVPIAVFDALTAGVAGKFIAPALRQGVKKAAVATGKEIALQAAGGAAGEAAAQAASGQQLSVKDIVAEALGEIATGPTEAYSNLREAGKARQSIRRKATDESTTSNPPQNEIPQTGGLPPERQSVTPVAQTEEQTPPGTPQPPGASGVVQIAPEEVAKAVGMTFSGEQKGQVPGQSGYWDFRFKEPGIDMFSVNVPIGATPEQVVEARDKKLAQIRPKVQTDVGQQMPQGSGLLIEDAPETPTITQLQDTGKHPVLELPLAELKLSKEVPNFKGGASEETGTVTGEELKGKYERLGTGPIVIWQRLNGDKEIITGRHRTDLARRSGETTIPAQIVREADGFTRPMAAALDAESNIREGQGSVRDYGNFFRNVELTRDQAEARGLLGRAKGRAGFALGRHASDDLYALYADGKIAESAAVAIAEAAPNNPQAQRIGARKALEGKSATYLSNFVKAALAQTGGKAENLDLFGEDDPAINAVDAMTERAVEFSREISQQIQAVSGAAKNPEAAGKLGVDVKDPEAVKRKLLELRAEAARWEEWPSHPDLLAKARGEVAPVAPAAVPKLRPGEKGTGDLLQGGDAPFNLAGERATDVERIAAEKAKAEADAKAAKELADKQQLDLLAQKPSTTETIVAAALRDPATGEMWSDLSHPQAWGQVPNPENRKLDSGFITSTGRYVDRAEASRISGKKTGKAQAIFGNFASQSEVQAARSAAKNSPPPQPSPAAVEKFRVGKSPQLFTLVERLPQDAAERENNEQPVRVRNDKTGEVQVVMESDLTPVKERAAEDKAKAPKRNLDAELTALKLDPSAFPNEASKREAIKRAKAKENPNLGTGLPEGEGWTPDQVRQAIAGEQTAGFAINIISKEEAERITGDPAARGYGGFFYRGQVYLVHENIGTALGAKKLLREEVGHGLLRTPEGLKLLGELLDAGKLNLTEAERKSILDQGYGEANVLDEFIAKSARENRTWWQEFVARVREFLSKLGLTNLTNEETARMLLRAIKDQRSGSQAVTGVALPEIAPGRKEFKGEDEGESLTNKGAKSLSKPTIPLDKIPQQGEHYEIVPKGDKDPLGYGNTDGKFFLTPDNRWVSVQEHDDAGREILKAAKLPLMDEAGEQAGTAALQLTHGWVRVIEQGNELYIESTSVPTASQLRELKNVAIEYRKKLVQSIPYNPARPQAQTERVIYDPADGGLPNIAPSRPEPRDKTETEREYGPYDPSEIDNEVVDAVNQSDLPAGQKTQILGEIFKIKSRPVITSETWTRAAAEAKKVFDAAGVSVEWIEDEGPQTGYWRVVDINETNARKLSELVKQAIATQDTPQGVPADLLGTLINSIRENYKRGDFEGLSESVRYDLTYTGAQSEASRRGRLLAVLSGFKNSIINVAKNADVEFRDLLADRFGGETIRRIMDRVLVNFRDYFTDAELADIYSKHPELEKTVEKILRLTQQDAGGRVYRKVQARLKPKKAKTEKQLRNDALVEEEATAILERAKALGIEEKKRPGKTKLTAREALVEVVAGNTPAKIEQAIQIALAEAEQRAGEAIAKRDGIELAEDEKPTDEQIAEGLKLPEFAHWERIRDNWLGYSPTTIKLVQGVLSGDFKGTKFKADTEKPADTRIDLAKLATERDTEIQRVFDAYTKNLADSMDLAGAKPETRQRVAEMVRQTVNEQLKAARQRILDNFLEPKTVKGKTVTPGQQLERFINAGLAKDVRFNTAPVQRLLQRVSQAFAKTELFDDLAARPRQEKAEWIRETAKQALESEGMADAPPEFRNYAESVVFNDLATRLQAAEERLVMRILDGPDAKIEPAPATASEIGSRLERATTRLEGAINAGLLDTAMVENIARKSAVQTLTPNFRDLIRQALATPFYRQSELGENFARLLVDELGVDPAQADKAKAVFESAFNQKFRVARKLARDKALDALTPQERKLINPRKPTWQKLLDAINTGVFDTGEVLTDIAKAHKWEIPTPGVFARFKELARRLQELQTLTPAEAAKVGRDPLDLEHAQRDKFNATVFERVAIKKEIEALWSKYSRPMNWRTLEGRQNGAAALMEISAANMLFKLGFPVRQAIDVVTQGLVHAPTRAIGAALEQFHADRDAGRPTHFFEDANKALKGAYKQRWSVWRATLANSLQGLRGRSDARNVERLLSGVAAFERLDLRADEMAAKGNHAGAFALRLLGILRFGYRIAQAFDSVHGTPAQFQEMRQQAVSALIESGMPRNAAYLKADDVMGDFKAEWGMAVTQARQILEDAGLTPSDNEVRAAAGQIIKGRAYQKMREMGLPADDFEESNRLLANTIGWNEREVGGLGGIVADVFRAGRRGLEGVGLPLPIFNFGNAIGISINRALSFTPLGFIPEAFGVSHAENVGGLTAQKSSPWYRTPLDRNQRKLEAAIGTTIGSTLFALAAAGILVVRNKWPEDKEERELWERQGHKPGTVELPTGDGSFIPISLSTGPLSLVRPYLAAGGAMNDLFSNRAKAQEKLNADAAKKGVPAGKIRPIDTGDVLLVAWQAAQNAVTGGRTAAGFTGSFSDMGIPNSKKFVAALTGPLIPTLPALQEVSRMAGVRLDAKLAGVGDFLLPLPTSQAAAVNILGDKVGTVGDIQRITQVLTAGTFPGVVNPKDAADTNAYKVLFASGYRPPSINPNQGYLINGEIRPFTDAELAQYSRTRGERLKQALSTLPENATKEAARAAYQGANTQALSDLGASRPGRAASATAAPATPSIPAYRPASGRARSAIGRRSSGLRSGRLGRSLATMKVPRLSRARTAIRRRSRRSILGRRKIYA